MNIGISEREVIRYVLYTWQGIDGVIFKLNLTTQMYYVDEKVRLMPVLHQSRKCRWGVKLFSFSF